MNPTDRVSFDFSPVTAGYVFESIRRASSVLETVSSTSCWGEAFFGADVFYRTARDALGLVFHKKCWPRAGRRGGYFQSSAPLPFIAEEIV